MGYTTMGHNFASAFYVQLVAILIAPTVAGTTNIGENFSTGIVPIGIAAIVLGILGMIFIATSPGSVASTRQRLRRDLPEGV